MFENVTVAQHQAGFIRHKAKFLTALLFTKQILSILERPTQKNDLLKCFIGLHGPDPRHEQHARKCGRWQEKR